MKQDERFGLAEQVAFEDNHADNQRMNPYPSD